MTERAQDAEDQLRAELEELRSQYADLVKIEKHLSARSNWRFYVAIVLLVLFMVISSVSYMASARNSTAINDIKGGGTCGVTALFIEPEIRAAMPQSILEGTCPDIAEALDDRDMMLAEYEEYLQYHPEECTEVAADAGLC